MREADEIHGIFETENRSIEIDAAAMRFKFVYKYYYERESGYVMVTQTNNDAELEGSLQQEGGKVTAIIEKGTQKTKVKTGLCRNWMRGPKSGRISRDASPSWWMATLTRWKKYSWRGRTSGEKSPLSLPTSPSPKNDVSYLSSSSHLVDIKSSLTITINLQNES